MQSGTGDFCSCIRPCIWLLCDFSLPSRVPAALAYTAGSAGSYGMSQLKGEGYFSAFAFGSLASCNVYGPDVTFQVWANLPHSPSFSFHPNHTPEALVLISSCMFSVESQKNQYTRKHPPSRNMSFPCWITIFKPSWSYLISSLKPFKSLLSPGCPCQVYPAFKNAFATAHGFKRLNSKQHFPRLCTRNQSFSS